MTSRIDSPDTAADEELKAILASEPRENFVMTAGAGSGKTTSLIKALAHVLDAHGPTLRQNSQKIACITYTEIAVREILEDVGDSPLLSVSTLHSFLWNVIRPFQRDIARDVRKLLEDKIARGGKSIERDRRDLASLDSVRRFIYQTGSRYAEGILGHSDIITMGPRLVQESPLLARIIGQRFPYIFVDESQDTYKSVVDALMMVSREGASSVCLGFFGDPMQMIYTTGVGSIDAPGSWRRIPKPENFRCPRSVLKVINEIRRPVDSLVQTGGRTETVDGNRRPVEGNAQLIVLPADQDKSVNQELVRRWLAEETGDGGWWDPNARDKVKILVIEHRHAADRLKFPELYAAFTDQAPSGLSTAFREGTSHALAPFQSYLLPLCSAHSDGRKADVVKLLRRNSSILGSGLGDPTDSTAGILDHAKASVNGLCDLLDPDSSSTIADVIELVTRSGLAELDLRLTDVWEASRSRDATAIEELDRESRSLLRFIECPARELWGYQEYIEGNSPYSTHQGVKGAEFERVLVVLDDSASRHFQFSYDKLFAVKELSKVDRDNIAAGRDSVLERTRRLFYVCCSRATASLAVVMYALDVDAVYAKVCDSGLFDESRIYTLAHLKDSPTLKDVHAPGAALAGR